MLVMFSKLLVAKFGNVHIVYCVYNILYMTHIMLLMYKV